MTIQLAAESQGSKEAVAVAMGEVKQALRALAANPHVDEIQLELATDSNGKDAAFITIVLEDDPSGDTYPWARLKPIHDLIWEVFTDRAVSRWPFIKFHLKSELEDEPEGVGRTPG